MTISTFQKKIYEYYKKHKRSLPWRQTRNPYHILVSEMMLQQTQAKRVIPKYSSFLKQFPDVQTLARASIHDVLLLWQGLGYNRRALSLKKAAEVIVSVHDGVFPKTYQALLELPGVGSYTASALMSFAYDKPSLMIETNIRTVFIHFFFSDIQNVTDADILPLIEKYADVRHPREWYNALMDYGAMLKESLPNPSRRSKHHAKQSNFKGSVRQVRGAIIKAYTENKNHTKRTILRTLPYTKEVVESQYKKLVEEGFFK